ncbi:hypothetical protein [Aliarcobacter cibarius]|uniref:hypothetical protein n=1 Tax=Aliarcobacter cibarius TaxID=255507 RepID=UPI000463B24D|nr:hypothetical protein [Aliarcobacter cibarius]
MHNLGLSIVKFNQAKKEYFLAKEYLDVADDIYDLTKIENEVNINSRLILIKEKLNNILATLRYSASYANVQNSYGRIFASLGINENKKVLVDKVEDTTVTKASLTEDKKILEETSKVVNEIEEIPQNNNTIVQKEIKSTIQEDSLFNKNFNNSKIKIYKDEKLLINDKEYIVKESDDISKIAKQNGMSIKQIVIDNFWLVEKDRIEFK